MILTEKKTANIFLRHLLFIVISLIIFWTFSTGIMSWRVDTWFHINRILEIDASFYAHQIPGPVNVHSFLSVGQAMSSMYPSYSMWIPLAIFHKLNLIQQWWMLISLFTFIALEFTTFLADRLSKSYFLNTLYGMLSVLSFAFAATIYSGSMGQFIADLFVPATLITNYLLIKRRENFYWLSIALSLVALSHILTAAFIVIVIILTVIVHVITTKEVSFLREYFKAAGLTFFLTAPVWAMPLVLRSSHLLSVADTEMFGTNMSAMLSSALTNNGVFGIIPAVAIVLSPIMLIKYKSLDDSMYLVMGLMFFVGGSSLFPWSVFQSKLGNIIQSPEWRLAPISAQLICFGLFIFIMQYAQKHRESNSQIILMSTIVFFIFALLPLFSRFNNYRNVSSSEAVWTKSDGYWGGRKNTLISSQTIKDKEFLNLRFYADYAPRTANNKRVLDSVGEHKYIKNGNLIELKSQGYDSYKKAIVFTFDKAEKGQVDLPFWNYKAFHYNLVDDKGNKVSYTRSKRHTLSVQLSNLTKHVYLQSISSLPYAISLLVLFISWIGIIIFLMIKLVRQVKANWFGDEKRIEINKKLGRD